MGAATIHKKITRLENKINWLEKVIDPIVKERDALKESHDKILISCDASFNKTEGSAVIGVIIRMPGKEPYHWTNKVKAQDSNEAELSAIYTAVSTFLNLFAAGSKYNVELRSDSRYCIGLLTGKKKSIKLSSKVGIVLDLIVGIRALSNKKLDLVWKRRNSTFDLNWAHNLTQGN
jgi:ribonuclease HI